MEHRKINAILYALTALFVGRTFHGFLYLSKNDDNNNNNNHWAMPLHSNTINNYNNNNNNNNYNNNYDLPPLPTATNQQQKQKRPRVPVALCTIQKDGEAYLDEWIQYNLALGFTKIYLYDNSDGHDLKQWAQRHESNDRIQVIPFPGTGDKQQYRAYHHCLQMLKNQTANANANANHDGINTLTTTTTTTTTLTIPKFVAFFDLDEFLVLHKHQSVEEFVAEHCPDPNCTSLVINWHVFGPNGEQAYTPIPVTKRFQYRLSLTDPHVKSIARVATAEAFRTVHCVQTSTNITNTTTKVSRYDTMGPGAKCPFNHRRPTSVAVLNHIYTKSEQEWNARCQRGRADSNPANNPGCKPMPYDILKEDPTPMIWDDSSWKFLTQRVPAYQWFDQNEWMFGWTSTTSSRIHYYYNTTKGSRSSSSTNKKRRKRAKPIKLH